MVGEQRAARVSAQELGVCHAADAGVGRGTGALIPGVGGVNTTGRGARIPGAGGAGSPEHRDISLPSVRLGHTAFLRVAACARFRPY